MLGILNVSNVVDISRTKFMDKCSSAAKGGSGKHANSSTLQKEHVRLESPPLGVTWSLVVLVTH